jgi:hypothetical protein
MRKYLVFIIQWGWLLPLFGWADIVNGYLISEVQPRMSGAQPLNSFPYLHTMTVLLQISAGWALVAFLVTLIEINRSHSK